MDGYGHGSCSGPRSYGGDRRLEIVSSGKSFSGGVIGNQIYEPHDLPQTPPRVIRPIQNSPSKPWGFTDPEMKRKKRIAKYKVYNVEGKVKASLRKGIRWIKNKCSQIVHGY